jgi:allantoin racemase
MTLRVNFINPFGTTAYNDLIQETLTPYAAHGTELTITNTTGVPENIDYYYHKHIIELGVMEDIMRAEEAGFDAVIVGCCYDPGVRVARELVDIPVIGPFEACLQMVSYFGHGYVVVTDHHKGASWQRDLVSLYGSGNYCRDVRSIDWWVTDMIKDTAGVARDAQAAVKAVLQETGAEAAIFGCTIIAAATEKWLRDEGAPRDLTIINPNIMALKMAESLGQLKKAGAYNVNRRGYYDKPQRRDPKEFAMVRARFGKAGRNEPA